MLANEMTIKRTIRTIKTIRAKRTISNPHLLHPVDTVEVLPEMTKLEIADVLIEIESKRRNLHVDLLAFKTKHDRTADMKVKFHVAKELSYPEGEIIMDDDIGWYRPVQDRYQSFFRQDGNKLSAVLDVDSFWSDAEIRIKKCSSINYAIASRSLIEILFRNHILLKQGLVIHAAAIKWQRKGIMFSAPSGTGKSTQAGLWNEYMDAEIINGDRPAVRIKNSTVEVYGTPWSGQISEFRNDKADLSAIIMLEQADENKLEQLNKKNAVSMLMPRCFLPYQDAAMMDIAIKNLEALLALVPVYHLKCRPDKGAVEMVYQCVK